MFYQWSRFFQSIGRCSMYIRTPEEANEHKSLKERSEIGALSNALFGKVRDGFLQD